MAHIEDRWKRDGRRGTGRRWRARYTDPDSAERSRSFDRKVDAERFLAGVEHSKNQGTYRDPDLGRVTLRKYATEWLDAQVHDPVTRDGIESRLRVHVFPALGGKTLAELAARPSAIQGWAAGLPLAPSSARGVFAHLAAVMAAAVRDDLIGRNPCTGTKLPKTVRRRVDRGRQSRGRRTAGPGRQVSGDRRRARGLGLRQSELFGLSVDEVDFLRRMVHVRQQVKLIRGQLYFAPPKGGKSGTSRWPRRPRWPCRRTWPRSPPPPSSFPGTSRAADGTGSRSPWSCCSPRRPAGLCTGPASTAIVAARGEVGGAAPPTSG